MQQTRKVLLNHLVKMHDQYILDMLRKGKQAHEKKHREFRKRQKKAIDMVLDATHLILDWPDDRPLNKVDMDIVEEQWDEMIHVATSLKERTASAHVIVERLTNSFPSDRLAKAFTNLGRIIKTEYILR